MSKVSDIWEKYSKTKMAKRTFDSLNLGDTTPTKKYLDYMCYLRLYQTLNTAEVKELISKFDNLLPYIVNKDIYSSEYKNIRHLRDTIKTAESVKEEKTFIKEDHVDIIYDENGISVLYIKTLSGANKYGAGTKWCITGRKAGNDWKSYSNSNYIYFIINKCKKFALIINKKDPLFGGISIFNTLDQGILPSQCAKELKLGEESFYNLLNLLKNHSYSKSKISIITLKFNRFINIIDNLKAESSQLIQDSDILTEEYNDEVGKLFKEFSASALNFEEEFSKLKQKMGI